MTNTRTICIKITFMDCQTELANLTIPKSVTEHDIQLALSDIDTKLFETNIYDTEGFCANTLLSHLVKNRPDWSYTVIQPDMEWIDTTTSYNQ